MFFTILLHDLSTAMDPSVLFEFSIIRDTFGPYQSFDNWDTAVIDCTRELGTFNKGDKQERKTLVIIDMEVFI